jgi:hypothetical protein
MSSEIPIFYEDEWGFSQFGLHEVIVSCIADLTGLERFALRKCFSPNPKKGAGKLLAFCSTDIERWPHRLSFAIFDADKLHKLLYPSGRPTTDVLHAELRRRCPDPLHPFLLEDNTETVVDAAARCLNEPTPAKNKLLRDRMLNRVASGAPQLRDCIRAAVPSFDHCVRYIAALSEPLLRRA